MKTPTLIFFVVLLFIGLKSVAQGQAITPNPANVASYIEEVYAVSNLGNDTTKKLERFPANPVQMEIYQAQVLHANANCYLKFL